MAPGHQISSPAFLLTSSLLPAMHKCLITKGLSEKLEKRGAFLVDPFEPT
jgi:hypothetical protein